MNFFDSGILSFLIGFSGRSRIFDLTLSEISSNSLLKGGVIVGLVWWAWFRRKTDKTRDREHLLVSALFGGVVSIALARALAAALPFRERPIRNPALSFRIPYGTDPATALHWSSFPSDHASLFFALSASLLFVSRRAGIFALLYSFFVVCLPRVYLGIHYPTDILAGAILGTGTACLLSAPSLRKPLSRPVLRLMEKSPGAFYALFFVFTFQMAVNFDHVRYLAHGLLAVFKHV